MLIAGWLQVGAIRIDETDRHEAQLQSLQALRASRTEAMPMMVQRLVLNEEVSLSCPPAPLLTQACFK